MTPGEYAVATSLIRYWKKIEGIRVANAQKMWDWYYNDISDIKQHVIADMKRSFRASTINKINIRIFNIVPRVVNKIAAVYKEPVQRTLDGGVQITASENGEKKAQQTKDDERFQKLLSESTINKKSLQWHRMGKYFNTVLVQPVWKEDKDTGRKYMDFHVHTPAFCAVESDEVDYLKPKAFYFSAMRTVNGKQENVLVYWSATEHCYIDILGNKIALKDNPQMKNPYGILPAAVLRFTESNDFWGEGMQDLPEGNSEICEQVSNLFFTAKFQSHGQAVAINLGLKGEPQVGADRPIVVNKAMKEEVPPDFFFAQPNPALAEVRNLIDWSMRMLQALKGLSPQQYDVEKSIQSGVSKIVDATEITEIREEDVVVLSEFEKQLSFIVRRVYNVHNPNEKISETAVFNAEFTKPKITKSTQDKVSERSAGLGSWMTLEDIVREDNPNFSDDQVQTKVAELKSEQKGKEEKQNRFKNIFDPTK